MNKKRGRNGRRPVEPFTRLPREMLLSAEWAELTAFEVRLFVDLAVQYNGRNNGDLCATWQIMRKRGWRSPGTLSKALRGLRDRGWVELTRQGGKHRASLYAITIHGIDECKGKLDVSANPVPSNHWRKNSSAGRDVNQSSRAA